MQRLPGLGVLLIVCSLMLPVGAAEARAAARAAADPFYCSSTCNEKDAGKDAPARADLLRARLVNGKSAHKVRFKVRDLGRTGSFVLGAGLSGWGVNWYVVKRRHGYTVKHQTISEVTVYPKKRCGAARVTWSAGKNVVSATLPHSCTGSTAGGGSIINGLTFRSGGASDRMGKVFYQP